MKIFEKLADNAITESPELPLTKGISALIVAFGIRAEMLTKETISVWVEKAGKNDDIAKEMLLKDFILLGTFGEDIIQSDTSYASIAHVDLTQDSGYINLSETDTIKFKLRNLVPNVEYALHGTEAFFPSSVLNRYERKSMGSEDVSRDFDVKGYDLASLQKDESITEISLTHENGSVAKFTPFELEVICRSVDSSNIVQDQVIMMSVIDRFVFPVHQIVNINIRKEPRTRLDLSLRIDELDYIRYQMPAN
jgi:hypothetical protein